MELDGYLRDFSSSMMEVNNNNEITHGGETVCLAPTLRGEADCRQTVGEIGTLIY